MWRCQIQALLLIFLCSLSRVFGGAVQITSSNIDSILSSNELVFVNFYANWCRFSQMLNPIYDELADKIAKEYPQPGHVTIGKIDCDSEGALAAKYHVNKYPTLKLFRHGALIKREYRGARQVDAFVEYIRKKVASPMVKLSTMSDLMELDSKKRYIVGHFADPNSPNYVTFSKVANLLQEECNFAASTGSDDFKGERPAGDVAFYHPPQILQEKDGYYMGPIDNHEAFYAWANEKCIPLVREITFENAEELTDEGLPFLILFHDANDHEIVADFEREVAKQLMHERSSINCLHADGAKFVHPLHHLGKSAADLPLLTIDSFRHMFLFPDIKQMKNSGKLLQFVQDLHSGKLHQDFHNPPPPTPATPAPPKEGGESQGKADSPHLPKTSSVRDAAASAQTANQFIKSGDTPSAPPESVFVRLSPSRSRYSFRDEL